MTRRVLVTLAVASVSIGPAAAQSDGGRPCAIVWDSMPPTSHAVSQITASGKYTTWFGGGFRARCSGTHMLVTSDSAEHSPDARVLTLYGNAHFVEDSASIDADMIRYTELDARIAAEGHVRVRARTGSTLTTERLWYYRPLPPTRPYTMAETFERAHLVLRDSVPAADSTIIDADRLHMRQDSLFYAGGKVIITRPDMTATADSVEMDSGRNRARLSGGAPRIEGRGGKKFSVEGTILHVFGRARGVDRLVAQGKAVAVSDSLRLSADTLDINTTGTQIDHVIAWGPGRAHATSADRDIVASRIELNVPGGKLRDIIATGKARADTKPDSGVRGGERDWIEGDTIVATFDLTAKVDSGNQPPLRIMIARGNARSLYQIAPKNAADTMATINYVAGNRIEVAFIRGDVKDVRVTGQVQGLNLTPVRKDTTATSFMPPHAPRTAGRRR